MRAHCNHKLIPMIKKNWLNFWSSVNMASWCITLDVTLLLCQHMPLIKLLHVRLVKFPKDFVSRENKENSSQYLSFLWITIISSFNGSFISLFHSTAIIRYFDSKDGIWSKNETEFRSRFYNSTLFSAFFFFSTLRDPKARSGDLSIQFLTRTWNWTNKTLINFEWLNNFWLPTQAQACGILNRPETASR